MSSFLSARLIGVKMANLFLSFAPLRNLFLMNSRFAAEEDAERFNRKLKRRIILNRCFGVVLSVFSILPVFLFKFTDFASLNLLSTKGYYYFYQYFVIFFTTGINVLVDVFESDVASFIFVFSLLAVFFFVSYKLITKNKKKKEEASSFDHQKLSEKKCDRVFYSDKLFITFSRFIS